MTRTHNALVIFLLLCCAQAAAAETNLSRLAWLAGCWSSETAEAGSIEQWMAPAGGTMLGVGRTIKDGKTREYEFMRIVEGPDDKLLYIALPSKQTEATFTQLQFSATEVVFENLEHDFPQRIIYRLDGDRLLASIEGMRNGKLRKIDYPMRRTSCQVK